MSIFGLGSSVKKPTNAHKAPVKTSSKDSKTAQSDSDEAKAMLEKMEAKKAAGDCPFC